jgi:hypothetical protein
VRIISEAECGAWLSERMQQPFSWSRAERDYRCGVAYLLPSDVGRRTALSRALGTLADCSREGLFWITEWGVFPSAENMALFDGYRRSLFEKRRLHEAPGHLFEEDDRQRLECLLDLTLYFFWDGSMFDAGAVWVRLSHDEVLSINARDEASLQRWHESLRRYELKELTRRS